MRYGRITAAIFDILLVSILLYFVISVIPVSENATKIINELNTLTDDVFKIDSAKMKQITEISYELDKEISYIYIVVALILIFYFILIPKWLNGQTIGYRFRKVRIVNIDGEKVSLNQIVIMAVLNSGLILVILFPLLLYILSPIWYPRATTFLIYLQILFWIVSFIMLIVKKRCIQDYIAKTKVIEVKR